MDFEIEMFSGPSSTFPTTIEKSLKMTWPSASLTLSLILWDAAAS
jgi:hypothetical protein